MDEEPDGVEKKKVAGILGRTKKSRIAKIFHKGAQVGFGHIIATSIQCFLVSFWSLVHKKERFVSCCSLVRESTPCLETNVVFNKALEKLFMADNVI